MELEAEFCCKNRELSVKNYTINLLRVQINFLGRSGAVANRTYRAWGAKLGEKTEN